MEHDLEPGDKILVIAEKNIIYFSNQLQATQECEPANKSLQLINYDADSTAETSAGDSQVTTKETTKNDNANKKALESDDRTLMNQATNKVLKNIDLVEKGQSILYIIIDSASASSPTKVGGLLGKSTTADQAIKFRLFSSKLEKSIGGSSELINILRKMKYNEKWLLQDAIEFKLGKKLMKWYNELPSNIALETEERERISNILRTTTVKKRINFLKSDVRITISVGGTSKCITFSIDESNPLMIRINWIIVHSVIDGRTSGKLGNIFMVQLFTHMIQKKAFETFKNMKKKRMNNISTFLKSIAKQNESGQFPVFNNDHSLTFLVKGPNQLSTSVLKFKLFVEMGLDIIIKELMKDHKASPLVKHYQKLLVKGEKSLDDFERKLDFLISSGDHIGVITYEPIIELVINESKGSKSRPRKKITGIFLDVNLNYDMPRRGRIVLNEDIVTVTHLEKQLKELYSTAISFYKEQAYHYDTLPWLVFFSNIGKDHWYRRMLNSKATNPAYKSGFNYEGKQLPNTPEWIASRKSGKIPLKKAISILTAKVIVTGSHIKDTYLDFLKLTGQEEIYEWLVTTDHINSAFGEIKKIDRAKSMLDAGESCPLNLRRFPVTGGSKVVLIKWKDKNGLAFLLSLFEEGKVISDEQYGHKFAGTLERFVINNLDKFEDLKPVSMKGKKDNQEIVVKHVLEYGDKNFEVKIKVEAVEAGLMGIHLKNYDILENFGKEYRLNPTEFNEKNPSIPQKLINRCLIPYTDAGGAILRENYFTQKIIPLLQELPSYNAENGTISNGMYDYLDYDANNMSLDIFGMQRDKLGECHLYVGQSKVGRRMVVDPDLHQENSEWSGNTVNFDGYINGEEITRDLIQILLNSCDRKAVFGVTGALLDKHLNEAKPHKTLIERVDGRTRFGKIFKRIKSDVMELSGGKTLDNMHIKNRFYYYQPIRYLKEDLKETQMLIVHEIEIQTCLIDVHRFFKGNSRAVAGVLNELTNMIFGGAYHPSFYLEVLKKFLRVNKLPFDTLIKNRGKNVKV
ncbi:MAG: hypothetical protein ACXADA_23070 [Candidatus Hodarchaeales archaeon]